ncbi:hypothetical protein HanIR_Chr01g0043561 [Helianthus annuus]|nr:hypothetical protein HanIR_Chr01g0043561 [Helianthus annuus]
MIPPRVVVRGRGVTNVLAGHGWLFPVHHSMGHLSHPQNTTCGKHRGRVTYQDLSHQSH